MVSNRWQRTQTWILHATLVLVAALPLFLFELPLSNLEKVAYTLIGYAVIFPVARKLHRRYATKFLRVFRCEYATAARIIQRTLNANRMPFTRRSGDDQITFQIRTGQMQLVVSEFPLNMLLDEHLKTEVAALCTLQHETNENASQMQQLRTILDDAFAQQGFK